MGADANNSTPERSGDTSAGKSGSKAGWILLGAAAVLAAGSVGFNMYDGGSEEETEQVADGLPSIADLREAAQASDGDAGPWAELGFAHYERGEFAESAEAYAKAVEIDATDAALWSALGEARAYAADAAEAAADPLPPEAFEAFQKALELDPDEPRARYFVAVKKDLDGEHEGAISDWLALLSDTPPGAPWEESLVRTIRQVGAIHDIAVDDRINAINETRAPEIAIPGSGEAAGAMGEGAASANVRGPTQQQIADASRMTPGEQDQMVAGMVASLEERLQNEPGNLDGWVMLMRSRMTLGETGKARDALAKAVAANPENADELRRQAAQLGIE